jgi:hypothetical protein
MATLFLTVASAWKVTSCLRQARSSVITSPHPSSDPKCVNVSYWLILLKKSLAATTRC